MRLAALVRLGGVAAAQGDRDRAAALHAEAAALARRTGQRRAAAHVRNEQGAAARMAGDLERARALHTEALVVVRELPGWSVPHTLAQLACAEARLGATGDATAHLREAAGLLLATPQPATAAAVRVGAALVAAGNGDPIRAARLLAVAEATYRAAGVAPVGGEAYEMALVREAVGVRPVDAGGLTAEAVLRTLTDG